MNTRAEPGSRPQDLLGDPLHLLALGFGTGCASFMPGTVGTAAGAVIYLALAQLNLVWYLVACGIAFVLGIKLCERTGKALARSDHPAIVWDEIVGMLVTMVAMPMTWYWLVSGFALFRLLDIAKPGPVGWLDRRLTGGLGVMLDDLAAALIACGILHLLLLVL